MRLEHREEEYGAEDIDGSSVSSFAAEKNRKQGDYNYENRQQRI